MTLSAALHSAFVFAAVTSTVLLASGAQAQTTPALTFDVLGEGFSVATASVTLGYSFSVNGSAVVSALGVYDSGFDGLVNAHDTGIFDSAGTLLVSTTIPSGSVAPLIDKFRYVSITPLLLSSGTYTIGHLHHRCVVQRERRRWLTGQCAKFQDCPLNYLPDKPCHTQHFPDQSHRDNRCRLH